MSIAKAIGMALDGKRVGDTFSIIALAEKVTFYRGKWTTDGSVSRYLRWWNQGVYDHILVLRWEVVSPGVCRIMELSGPVPKIKQGARISRQQPAVPPVCGVDLATGKDSTVRFEAVERSGEFYLF